MILLAVPMAVSGQQPAGFAMSCGTSAGDSSFELVLRAGGTEPGHVPRGIRISSVDNPGDAPCDLEYPWPQPRSAVHTVTGLEAGHYTVELVGGRVFPRIFSFEVRTVPRPLNLMYQLVSPLEDCQLRDVCAPLVDAIEHDVAGPRIDHTLRRLAFRLAAAMSIGSVNSSTAICLDSESLDARSDLEAFGLATITEEDCVMPPREPGGDDSRRSAASGGVARLLSARRFREVAAGVFMIDVGYSQGRLNAASWTCIVRSMGGRLVPIRCDLSFVA